MSIPIKTADLPALLQEQVTAAREAGFYASEAELVADAIRTLLAARPDVRLATVCRLYERGTISLGKAAEMAGLNVVDMKRVLHEQGVKRISPESADETAEMARATSKLRTAGRE